MESVDNVAERSPKQTGMSLPLRLTQSLPVRAKANVNTTQLRLILKANKQTDVLQVNEAGNNADLIAWCLACKVTRVISKFVKAEVKHLSNVWYLFSHFVLPFAILTLIYVFS